MTTSRERMQHTLEHRQPDMIPLDLGATPVSGMHVSTVYKLRQALGLDSPDTPVKVVEPYQMLGEIGDDLRDALGVDTVGVPGANTLFGFANENWKPWTTFDGTPVLVPERFNTQPADNGDILMYPQGDTSCPPCARMPHGGWYFDALNRQQSIDEDNLRIEDNTEEFIILPDHELQRLDRVTEHLYDTTDRALVMGLPGTAFGDIALVPAPWLKDPKGIRDVEEWYISTAMRRDFVYRIFERQCEIALDNLPRLYDAVGDRVSVVMVTGTDFGTQNAPFISPRAYCDLYQPFHRQINDWIHRHTSWKTFIHSCGSIVPLMEHFIEAGFDILNPVQCSAADMDAATLKQRFGDRLTFWGAGVDTQKTLPFGTPDQVRDEVKQRIETLGLGGGFVFNPVHNVQAATPIENILAMYETVRNYR